MIINGSCAGTATHGQHCASKQEKETKKEGERRRIDVLLDVDPGPFSDFH